MFTTDEKLFCEKLNTSLPGLEGIDVTFKEKGLAAAEKQLADYIRATLRPQDYFKIPYYERENAWALGSDDDFAAAEKIISGELRSCGTAMKFPDTEHIDWEANPTYNEYKEWTWQLSRHHEWRCLGWCYRQTGDEKYAKGFVDFLMSWCEQEPCPESEKSGATKCWRTIEAGIRMTKNWHYAFHAFYKSPYMTDHVITTYIKSMCDHGYRLRNYHASGNWLIMEMAGLSHIAMLYPFLNEAEAWGEYAFAKLAGEIDVQVYPDGFQYELTTNYHDVVIQNYHWVLCTAKAIGYEVPKALSDNLERMFELDIKIVCPDGKYPDLNDGNRAALKFWCNMGLNYFPNNDQIRYFATDGKEGKLPEYTSVALPYAGMAFMRTGWGKDDAWCFLDAGPFGKAHQHEDKLNVLMFAYGKEVMSDPGCYAYDNSKMRKFILDTRSHNCAMVDDLSQNRRAKYRWSDELITKKSDMKWSFSDDVDAVEGVYNEGYGPEFVDVTHTRKVLFFKRGLDGSAPFALVIDRFESGDGAAHTFQPSYQMGTQAYTDNGHKFTADHGDGVTMSIVGSDVHGIVIGQYEPIYMGWRKRGGANSEEFEHHKAPCVRFTLTGKSARLATALCPYKNEGKTVEKVEALNDVSDTRIKIVFTDGSETVIDESSYPCSENSPEKLM